MKERTEEEIRAKWKGHEPPLVSVVCIAYNHESYINDAINGFIVQETDFPFEIIIHDDASTDGTTEIIKEYAERFPNLIKPVLQRENQYSKGKNPFPIAASYARGEYIALCEGDDYWTDPNKIQIQVEEMRKHPQCNMSYHPALATYMDGSKPDKVIKKRNKGNKIFTTSEIIVGGGFCPTASMVMRRNVIDILPEWYCTKVLAGDLYLEILGSLNAGLLYIDRVMSVRRENVPGSWCSKRRAESNDDYLRRIELHEECYQQLNRSAAEKYTREVNQRIGFFNYILAKRLLKNRDYSNFRKFIEKSWKLSPYLSFKQTLLYFCRKTRLLLPMSMMANAKKDRYV